MRRSIYSDEDIRLFVQDLLSGRPADEICRVAGVSLRTLYRWRRRFGGLKPFAVQALRQLEQENRRLKAEVARGNHASGAVADAHPNLRSDLGAGPVSEQAFRRATVVGRYAHLRIR